MSVVNGTAGAPGALSRRVLLRLDDGSLVGSAAALGGGGRREDVIRLPVAQACAMGRAGQKEFERLVSLLAQHAGLAGPSAAHAAGTDVKPPGQAVGVGGDAGVRASAGPAAASARAAPPAPTPVAPAPGGKKRKTEAPARPATQAAKKARQPAASTPEVKAVPWGAMAHLPVPANFKPVAANIVQQIIKALGRNAGIFVTPVDANQVPDYYKIITNPVTLGQIKKRVDRGQYATIGEFCEDMDRMWNNCYTYNQKGSYVRDLGEKHDAQWKSLLEQTGWAAAAGAAAPSADRSRRGGGGKSTATSASLENVASYDIPAPAPRPSRAKPAPMPPVPPAPAPAAPMLANRKQPMTTPQMEALADGLSNLDGDELEAAIKIIQSRANIVGDANNNEIELDIDSLDPDTLWVLHAHLEKCQKRAARAAAAGDDSDDSDEDTDED